MTRIALTVGLISIALANPAVADGGDDHHHHHDIVVARTDGGQLTVEFDGFAPVEHILPPVDGLGLLGFFGDDPGFGALEADEPDEGLYTLAAGAEVYFEVVSFAPAFSAEPLSAAPLSSPGDQALLFEIEPGEEAHTHVDWFIDREDPDFAGQTHWDASFKLVDMSGTYAASESYTLRFVPEPASLGLVGIGLLSLVRRRHT